MRNRILALVLGLAAFATGIAYSCGPERSEVALRRFHESEGPEDCLMDPLILAGVDVVPLVLKEVSSRTMHRRRYAIRFLGNGRHRQALPTLKCILGDKSEADVFRGDALHAIFLIEESLGLELARTHRGDHAYLGQIARKILERPKSWPDRRSYFDALLSRHE